MAKSTHVIKYQENGGDPVSIALYSSKADLVIADNQAIALPVSVDGATLYAQGVPAEMDASSLPAGCVLTDAKFTQAETDGVYALTNITMNEETPTKYEYTGLLIVGSNTNSTMFGLYEYGSENWGSLTPLEPGLTLVTLGTTGRTILTINPEKLDFTDVPDGTIGTILKDGQTDGNYIVELRSGTLYAKTTDGKDAEVFTEDEVGRMYRITIKIEL